MESLVEFTSHSTFLCGDHFGSGELDPRASFSATCINGDYNASYGNMIPVPDALSHQSSPMLISSSSMIENEMSHTRNDCMMPGSHSSLVDTLIAESDRIVNGNLCVGSCVRAWTDDSLSGDSMSSCVTGSPEDFHLAKFKYYMLAEDDLMDCGMATYDTLFPDPMDFSVFSAVQQYSGNSGVEHDIQYHNKENLPITVKDQSAVNQRANERQSTQFYDKPMMTAYSDIEDMLLPADKEMRNSPFESPEISCKEASSTESASESGLQSPIPASSTESASESGLQSPIPASSTESASDSGLPSSIPVNDSCFINDNAASIDTSEVRRRIYAKHHYNAFEDLHPQLKNQSTTEVYNKCYYSTQSPGLQINLDNNKDHKNNSSGSVFNTVTKSKTEYNEICLVNLLISGAQAVATQDMDLASVILVRLKELVSLKDNTTQKAAAVFAEGLQHRIDGRCELDHATLPKPINQLFAAFQILHDIFPYIKFGHFTANQAILEAVEGEKRIHIVDFEIMEGIQWPPLIQTLALREGGPPQLRITALCRSNAENGIATVQETGRRLSEFASSVNLPFCFSLVMVNKDEEFNVSSVKHAKGEALVGNCMVHLLHMPYRGVKAVSAFLQGMYKLSPILLTLVEEELGGSNNALASYFLEAWHHYSAVYDSLDVCLNNSTEAVGRILLEQLFLAPRIMDTVKQWGRKQSSQPLIELGATYNWCSLARSLGFKSLPLSSQNLSQARMLVSLYKDGFNLEERSNRLLLGWQNKPLFAASAWN